MTEAKLVFSGQYHIISNASLVNNCIMSTEIGSLKTNSSLMQVESIAECSVGAFFNTFDLHLAIMELENQFLVFFLSGHLMQFYCI